MKECELDVAAASGVVACTRDLIHGVPVRNGESELQGIVLDCLELHRKLPDLVAEWVGGHEWNERRSDVDEVSGLVGILPEVDGLDNPGRAHTGKRAAVHLYSGVLRNLFDEFLV